MYTETAHNVNEGSNYIVSIRRQVSAVAAAAVVAAAAAAVADISDEDVKRADL